ncbi:hypothetical protein [Nitratireductor indicus]|uniref:hypothetical protein n=1 Tax=Nitratireductor indicus TaxID=721133 RepID=UPI0028756D70|nr:hypothetical protein [Nitratireductor indicus]MDS1138578.1 hypothetical protein [Nitratireductor indicus]
MPRFPTYQRSQGLSGGSTASYASSGAFTAPANAVANLGGALSDVGQAFEAKVEKFKNSQDDTWFSKARAETVLQMQQSQTEMRQQATDAATNFTDLTRAKYGEVTNSFLGAAPSPRARQMYEEWAGSYTSSVVGDAAQFQAQSALAKRDTEFAQTMLAHSQSVLADPGQYDAVYRRAMDDLEGAKQWMTPEQELKARQTVESELQLARARAEIQRDPKGFLNSIGVNDAAQTGAGAIDTVVDKIIGVESGGRASAKNPNSSAEGLGQFIDSTWLNMIKSFRPDIAAGKSNSEILALKTDPALSREMTKRYAETNANMLTSAGIPATAGNIYLAHFLGPAGARQVLRSGDDAALSSILPPSVIKANDFLAGKTVGWIKSWSDKKMGGANTPQVANDPRFARLDTGQILSLQQQAEQAASDIDRQQKAELTSQLASIKGAFQLGIATGDSGVTQQAILSSPLADDDKAQLINSLTSKQGDTRLAADTITRMDAGESLNPYSADDRKGVSLAYDSATGGGSLFADGTNAQAVLGYMYARSHIVPKTAMNEIRAGLVSADPKRIAASASVAAQLADMDRGGLEAAENGDALLKAATTYSHLTNNLGMTNEEAGQRMADMLDPEKRKARESLLQSEPVKKRIKDIDASEVRDIFDPGVFGFDPTLGETPMAESVMVSDYRDMFEESIVEAAGDEDLAKELASQRFQRLYGASALTQEGSGVVTRLPPEKTYPPAPDGTYSYIEQQVQEALAAEGVEFDSVKLKFYDQTERDFRSGKPAHYQIWYEKDGKTQMYNLPFFAVPPTEYDFSENRASRDQSRQDLMLGRDRDYSADNYLYGNPLTGTR